MKSLIDSDVILYKACTSTEYTTYEYPGEGTFRYMKDLSNYLSFQYDEEELIEWKSKVIRHTVTEPISHTYLAIQQQIDTIVRETDAQSYLLVVKGQKPNFRLSIPYPVEYKGGRAEKPSNFEAAKQFLHSLPCLYYAEGMEVDDAIGILLCRDTENTVACTTDKDILYGLPGLKYNLDTKNMFLTLTHDADRFHYMQMLMGDRVDNILGIPGIGPKTAEKLLPLDKEKEYWHQVIIDKYKEHFKEKWEDMFNMNKQLLWILREPLSG